MYYILLLFPAQESQEGDQHLPVLFPEADPRVQRGLWHHGHRQGWNRHCKWPQGMLPSSVVTCIRGHRPKSSLGDKMIARKDCKNCFKEGESKHLLGYGMDAGKNLFFLIFSQKYWRNQFFHLFFFSQKSSKCFMFLLHQGRREP